MSRVLREYLERAGRLSENGTVFVTVRLVGPEGHVPQDIGAKAIVTADGLAWGTVGGGRLEARAIDHAKEMIARELAGAGRNQTVAPELVRYELQRDLGMVCGGAATLFYEVSAGPSWTIAVFGAGHVAQAVVALLSTFHCNLLCVDHREEWLRRIAPRPNLRAMLAADPAERVPLLPAGAFCLCMTQGHATDLPIVRRILEWGGAGFIGVIGSEAKARALRSALAKEGFSASQIAGIHCPLGLPIGSNAPAEIAVSVAAQLLERRDAPATASAPATRAAGPLR